MFEEVRFEELESLNDSVKREKDFQSLEPSQECVSSVSIMKDAYMKETSREII